MSGSRLFTNQTAKRTHLTTGTRGLASELTDLRKDVSNTLLPMCAITVEEFTDVAAADDNAIVTTLAVIDEAVTLAGDDLDGTIGGDEISPPRNITITTSGNTPADAPATALITGLDVDGNTLTETISIAQTATDVAGVKLFAKVVSIYMPACRVTFACRDNCDRQ